MSALRWLTMRWLHRDRDALAEARAEAARSRERLAVTQRTVIGPLRQMHQENHFAELLIETLRRRE
jgi:hypothetical protein